VRRYLESRGACEACLEAAEKAWNEFSLLVCEKNGTVEINTPPHPVPLGPLATPTINTSSAPVPSGPAGQAGQTETASLTATQKTGQAGQG